MKKILIISLLFICLLSGCTDTGNPITCLSNVQKVYSDAIIVSIPGKRYSFLVKLQSGEIRYVTTMNTTNDELDNDIKLFNGDK